MRTILRQIIINHPEILFSYERRHIDCVSLLYEYIEWKISLVTEYEHQDITIQTYWNYVTFEKPNQTNIHTNTQSNRSLITGRNVLMLGIWCANSNTHTHTNTHQHTKWPNAHAETGQWCIVQWNCDVDSGGDKCRRVAGLRAKSRRNSVVAVV